MYFGAGVCGCLSWVVVVWRVVSNVAIASDCPGSLFSLSETKYECFGRPPERLTIFAKKTEYKALFLVLMWIICKQKICFLLHEKRW